MTFSSLLSPPQSGESIDPSLTFAFSLPTFGKRVSVADVELQYAEAITSLSDRLGKDQWFLGSQCVEIFVPSRAFLLNASPADLQHPLMLSFLHTFTVCFAPKTAPASR